MKTDDDAFVRIDEVLSGVKSRPATGLLYGLISFDSSPHRDKDSKWHISEEVLDSKLDLICLICFSYDSNSRFLWSFGFVHCHTTQLKKSDQQTYQYFLEKMKRLELEYMISYYY